MKRVLLLVFLIALSACKERIIHDLSEGEANRLVSHFHDHGLQVSKERLPEGTWAISVPKAQAAQAIVLLDQSRITRRARQVPARQGGFLASREQQQLEFARLLAHDIEMTLLTIDGVFEARVHLFLPTPDPILGARQGVQVPGSASVLLVASDAIDIPSLEVARVVSGASGIPSENVAVLVTAPTMNADIRQFAARIPGQEGQFSGSSISSFGVNQLSLVLGALALILGGLLLVPFVKAKFRRPTATKSEKHGASGASASGSGASDSAAPKGKPTELHAERANEVDGAEEVSSEDKFKELIARAREAA